MSKNDYLYGGICGNIIGIACYDFDVFHNGFTPFSIEKTMNYYSCDTVLLLAVASAISEIKNKLPMFWYTTSKFDTLIENAIIKNLEYYTRIYNHVSYGDMFVNWINSADHMPYNSCGNGSAIRSAYIGWIGNSIEEVERLAEISAQISHNHPDGIAGAKAVAGAIYFLRIGMSKTDVKRYISKFYNMNFTLRDVSSPMEFNATCQYTVPYAIAAVLENNSYLDTIRAACSIGGDMDTIPCIAGSIAEAIYDVPGNIKNKARIIIGDGLSRIIYGLR